LAFSLKVRERTRMTTIITEQVLAEMVGLDLGHKARDARVFELVTTLTKDPSRSIRGAAQTKAQEEAFYRLLRNGAVTMPALLTPHIAHTTRRCAAVPKVIVAHDTSHF